MRKYAAPLIIFFCCASALAAVAVPNLLNALNRKRQKETMADMRTIATALEARATDLNVYFPPLPGHAPTAADATDFARANVISYDELARLVLPTYTRKLPRKDGWGNDFEFRAGSYEKGSAQSYAIRSRGRDGKADAQQYAHRLTNSFDDDVVISLGNFVWYPEGI